MMTPISNPDSIKASLCRNGVKLVERKLRLLVMIEQHSWIKDAKDQNSNCDTNTIKTNKVSLCLHQLSIPTFKEFDRSVDASDVDKHDRYDGGVDDKALALGEFKTSCSQDKDGKENTEASHADELEDDTSNHKVGAWLGVFAFVGCPRSKTATAGLDQKSQDINNEEDPEVKLGPDDRVLRSDRFDEVTQRDVDCGSDKDGSDDEGGDLKEESNFVVCAFRRPRSANPADEFDVRRNG